MDKESIFCLFWNSQLNDVALLSNILEIDPPTIIFLAEIENPNLENIKSLLSEKYERHELKEDLDHKWLALYKKKGVEIEAHQCILPEYSIVARLKDREECIIGMWPKAEKLHQYNSLMLKKEDYIADVGNNVYIGEFDIYSNDKKSKVVNLYRYIKDGNSKSFLPLKTNKIIGDRTDEELVDVRKDGKEYYYREIIYSADIWLYQYYKDAASLIDEEYDTKVPVMLIIR